MALLDNLVSYWKLEESSGTRNDSHGGNHLTDNNTVGSAAGKLGDAASFDPASSEYLSHSDNTDLSTGDIDFTFACWVYANSLSGVLLIFSKTIDGVESEYDLAFYDNRFRFSVNSGGPAVADSLGTPSTATWYYLVCWHDAAGNTINIQVNNGTVDSVSFSGGGLDSIATFRVAVDGAGNRTWDGRIDALGFWKKVLSSQERSDLYNGGNGLEYPFSSSNHRLALLGMGA